MTNYSVKNVDEFIAASPEVARHHMEELRKVVKAAVPEAAEGIHYGKPYYKYHGYLAGFDTYTNHITFEIFEGQLQSEDRKILEDIGYKTGSKSFQIRYDQEVPTEILEWLLKVQAKVNEAKGK